MAGFTVEADGTIRLAEEFLSHKRGGDCKCDGKAHPVTADIDLAAVLEYETNPATGDPLTAHVLPEPWEKAIQGLHTQAGHATAYADNCHEPGCRELYGND